MASRSRSRSSSLPHGAVLSAEMTVAGLRSQIIEELVPRRPIASAVFGPLWRSSMIPTHSGPRLVETYGESAGHCSDTEQANHRRNS